MGLSATENVIKEMREEAGIRVSVTGLYGVRHKAKEPGSEIIDAAFFTRDGLPPLSKGRVIERDIEAAFVFHESPERTVIVD